ncbi:MAG: MGMT family protein [Atopobiaceae bacterium]|jgi:methylated-DNA-protein-cysteine methyltransferase-like protein|nr:MGMT family protein [Atopobiaceae bacterium]MCI2173213.1 MGMT family protein [Atopobiaceae bacterium]MCI2207208.1 MGMT family protein [Atopobiaceae bacterium]
MAEHEGPSGFGDRVYEVVCRIPRGKVASYGQVARLAGSPRCARMVGWALHRNPRPGVIPCHRVVFKDGSVSSGFAFGGPEVQRSLLADEGVVFLTDGKVDLDSCGWNA